MKKISYFKWLVPLSLLFLQCTETPVIPTETSLGFNALIEIVQEPAGENCSAGGSKILVGQDENSNGNLDTTEIQSISFVCNGNEGPASGSLLSRALPESPGENCENGGTRIEIGIDENSDGNLNQEEILSTFFVCNGENGSDGSDGENGVDGQDGTNGLISIVKATVESSGSDCENGGLMIEVGLDVNSNAVLEAEEVESTYFVCNGADGNDGASGFNTLSKVTTETSDSPCDSGGLKISLGLDSNRNGSLDDDEIASENFLCNGANGLDGSNGISSLIRVTPLTLGEPCSAGGLQVEVGLDENNNNSLDDEEVQYTYNVCNGQDGSNGENGNDGFNTIISSSVEDAAPDCTSGGVALTIGLDSNRNGTIDEGEDISTYFVCNGNDGADGRSIILVTTPAGVSCENEGTTFVFGYDTNADGDLLDVEDEITETITICNGTDGSDGAAGSNGSNTIIMTTNKLPDGDCPTGGLTFEVGLDVNSNNSIDEGEEVGSYYVCNGTDGANGSNGTDGRRVTLTSASAGATCANGGTTFSFGYDGNADGDLLDVEDEIIETVTICNGADGSDGAAGSNGLNTIIVTTNKSPDGECPTGGLTFVVGLDANSNNSIDAGEEVGSYYVCNGSNGSNGSNGNTSLISVTPFDDSQGGCTNGGLIIRTGIDDNDNGVLDDPDEVDATSYVCNGNDGASDQIFEFYFSEGLNGYTGVRDVAISPAVATEMAEIISVDRLSASQGSDFHGLIYFPQLETITETVGTTQFDILESTLYLRGVSTIPPEPANDNYIGVKVLRENAPLFIEEECTWQNASNSETWTSEGASVTENAGAFDFSDMYRLPQGIEFRGYIPLMLNRSEIRPWVQGLTSNKGVVLSMVQDGEVSPYELDIYSSNYEDDPNFRPLLYIKVQLSSEAGRVSTQNQSEEWAKKNYEEKLAPLKRIGRH